MEVIRLKNILDVLGLGKKKYLVKAIGWSKEEAEDLEARLNSEKRFTVITKDVGVLETR